MNRIAQLIITLSVSFCAMSCIEEVGTELPNTSDYITVTSEVDMQTKAGYEGTSVLPGSFTMTIKQGTGAAKDYTMNRAGTSSNHYNFSGNAPTWTTSDVSQVSIKAITASEEDVADGILDFSVQTDQSSDSAVQSSDLLGAKTGAGITISGNNVNVAFNHLMSKLQVSYTSSLAIHHFELVNVCKSGEYSFSNMRHLYPESENQVSTGNITMFHNANTAEAIFFPYAPKTDPELYIYFDAKGENYAKCNISLKDGARFYPGKIYMMNISVSGTSIKDADIKIENWGSTTETIPVPGEKILWVGTSIPASSGYPEIVAEALNCTVVNNAVGGSKVLGVPEEAIVLENAPEYYVPFKWLTINWDQYGYEHGWNYLMGGGLSQTKLEASEKYKQPLTSATDKISNKNWPRYYPNTTTRFPSKAEWVTQQIEAIQALSYEELIIPYIDGTKDDCTTVIIDHGFNDLYGIDGVHGLVFEAGAYPAGPILGSVYLNEVKHKGVSYEEYRDWLPTQGFLQPEASYILAMSKIILAIREIDPSIKIIIGNYFTADCPYVNTCLYPGLHYTGVICAFNEAVAGMWDLDIVNVQNHLWIEEDQYWAGWDPNTKKVIYDPTKFCPDGVHPTNPDAARAIADVYINALDGVIGSRVK